MNQPVTVLIASSRPDMLPLCLQSILNQSSLPSGIVVVWDVETPGTTTLGYMGEVAKRKGIKLDFLYSGGHKGQVESYNLVYAKIPTPYIFRMDDDEVLEPNVLACLCETMSKDDKIGAVG